MLAKINDNGSKTKGDSMGKTKELTKEQIENLVWKHAKEAAEQGEGYAQEGVVMRQIADDLSIQWDADITVQHRVLDAWHDLFAKKKLGWGFNLDNPGSPFFHIRQEV
jgi:hypothetical protein